MTDLESFAVSGAAVRAAERPLLEAGRGEELMRRAAWALAQHVLTVLRERTGRVAGTSAAALVGSGNNGGDALWALAFLRRRGVACTAVPTSHDEQGAPRLHDAGAAALRAAGGRFADRLPAEADVVLDGILGTGAAGEVVLPAAARTVPAGAAVVACDVPTGVDADTGEVAGEVLAADSTVTFGALKNGLLLGDGAAASGTVHVVDIGLGPHLPTAPADRLALMDAQCAAALLPAPAADAHKYRRGLACVTAGSPRYPGAALLAVGGALAAGAGMVHLAAPDAVRAAALTAWPETVGGTEPSAADRTHTWVVGPGLDTDDAARPRLDAVLDAAVQRRGGCVVLDASALDLVTAEDLDRLCAAGVQAVLTPHAGEWARLTARLDLSPAAPGGAPAKAEAGGKDARTEAGRTEPVAEGPAGPGQDLRAFAAATGAVVLLKGAQTLVASPSGALWCMREGGPELAVAGTGDVLSGILGAVLAAAVARADRAQGSVAEADADAPVDGDRAAALAAAGAWLHAAGAARRAETTLVRASHLHEGVAAVLGGLWRGAGRDPFR